MRGNRKLTSRPLCIVGPIPARAGEPVDHAGFDGRNRAYPRACGGTAQMVTTKLPSSGLSPRVRGNHSAHTCFRSRRGPIPARAGEPAGGGNGRWLAWAYPRACGGTAVGLRRKQQGAGLSPRVRGNLAVDGRDASGGGPIPARAGEPIWCGRKRGRIRAYPRACGGTGVAFAAMLFTMGLSPRVRGNLSHRDKRAIPRGPIPARAGEPQRKVPPAINRWAYPRACGGTRLGCRQHDHGKGLSPRVRGNRAPPCAERAGVGPIPARAGEPARPCRRHLTDRAYPRACGGTPRRIL